MYYPRFENTLEHSFGCLPKTHFIWRLGCPVCSKSLLQCCSKLKSLKILQIRNSPKLWLGKRCIVYRLLSIGFHAFQASFSQKRMTWMILALQVEYQYDKPRVGVAGSGGWVVAINVSAVVVKECRGKRVVTWAARSDGQDMCQLNMSSSFQLEQRLFPVPSNFRCPISKLYYLFMSISPMYPRYPIIRSNISICMPWPARPPWSSPTCSGSSGIGSTAAVGGVAAVAGFRGALRWRHIPDLMRSLAYHLGQYHDQEIEIHKTTLKLPPPCSLSFTTI